jgi:hypothetical protein
MKNFHICSKNYRKRCPKLDSELRDQRVDEGMNEWPVSGDLSGKISLIAPFPVLPCYCHYGIGAYVTLHHRKIWSEKNAAPWRQTSGKSTNQRASNGTHPTHAPKIWTHPGQYTAKVTLGYAYLYVISDLLGHSSIFISSMAMAWPEAFVHKL